MALPALTEEPLTAERFEEADEGMSSTIALAEGGDVAGALNEFFGSSHDLTHDLDGPLRDRDEELAIRLCNQVYRLEILLGAEENTARVAEVGRSIRELLLETRDALGVDEGAP